MQDVWATVLLVMKSFLAFWFGYYCQQTCFFSLLLLFTFFHQINNFPLQYLKKHYFHVSSCLQMTFANNIVHSNGRFCLHRTTDNPWHPSKTYYLAQPQEHYLHWDKLKDINIGNQINSEFIFLRTSFR